MLIFVNGKYHRDNQYLIIAMDKFYFFQIHKAVGFGDDNKMPNTFVIGEILPLI